MRKQLTVGLLALTISGCSALAPVTAVTDLIKPDTNNGTQVDTTAQVGKDASRNTTLGASTKIDGDGAVVSHVRQDQTTTLGDVAGSVSVQNIANIPAWVILLLVLGWMMPKPSVILRSIIKPLYRKRTSTN